MGADVSDINGYILDAIRPKIKSNPTLKDVIVWAEGFQEASGTLSLGLALGNSTGCSPFCGCAAKQIAELVGGELRGKFPKIRRTTGLAALPRADILDRWGGQARPGVPSRKVPDPDIDPAGGQGPSIASSDSGLTRRVFRIGMSEKCYRFKPEALLSHAPQAPGVYEFVTFDAEKNPIVLYVGLALPRTVHDALSDHLEGRLQPTADNLLQFSKDVYFDYVASADVEADEDFKDIAGALRLRHHPALNAQEPIPSSGRYAVVVLQEIE